MILGLDYYNNMEVPSFVLCKPNGERIGIIPCTEKRGTVKFNDYDEISFTTYLYIDGDRNEIYDNVNELMHIELPEIGRYVITEVSINSEGTNFESKNCVALSEEVLLAQRYLENFMINTAEVGSVETGDRNETVEEYKEKLIQFYHPSNKSRSLMNLILDEKCPDWTFDGNSIGTGLFEKQRKFEVDRQDIYSFLTKDVSEAFECIFEFDTINHIIRVYPKDMVGENTDIHISYANLAKTVDISCSSDDIKTCFKLTGRDDLNVRDVNMGQDEIYNIDYFHSLKYMSQGLYDAYAKWKEKWEFYEVFYEFLSYGVTDNSLGLTYEIDRANNKVYMYRKDDPNGYKAWIRYTNENDAEKELEGVGLVDKDNPSSQNNLMWGYQRFFDKIYYLTHVMLPEDGGEADKIEQELFEFVVNNAEENKDENFLFDRYINELLYQYGLEPLKSKKQVYIKKRTVLMESGIGTKDHAEHWKYWNIAAAIRAVSSEINQRTEEINNWKLIQDEIYAQMKAIVEDLDMRNGKNFTPEQLTELRKFIREDELSDDNFSVNEIATYKNRYDWLNDFLEHGRKELAKVAVPTLSFSLDMANIHAIPEFQEYAKKFTPGNYMYVTLRDDFSLKVRLLSMDINFLDSNDFSVEFGNVAKLKGNKLLQDITEALSLASDAATSVSFNASYWNEANVEATAIGDALASGLLNAGNTLRTTESDVVIDEFGITVSNNPTSDLNGNKLYPEDTIFIGGGQILFSSDSLKTIRTALGRVQYTMSVYDEESGIWREENRNNFGLLAETVIAGYVGGSIVEGNKIIGGSIMSTNYEHGIRYDGDNNPIYNGTRINLEDGTFEFNAAGKQRLTLAKENENNNSDYILTVKGKIQADTGYIGGENGFKIGNRYMYSIKEGIDGEITNPNGEGIYIGVDGIGLGWNKDKKKTPFKVTPDGRLIASSGEIGGFEIGEKAIFKGKTSLAANEAGVYIGTDGIGLGNAFKVTDAGSLTATSGFIGGATIENGAIYVPKETKTRSTVLTEDNVKWAIKNDGTTIFTDVHISGVQHGSSFGGITYGEYGTFGSFNNGFSAGVSFSLSGGALNNFNTLVANKISANYITSAVVDAGFITADEIEAGYVKTSYLKSNYIQADEIESYIVNSFSSGISVLSCTSSFYYQGKAITIGADGVLRVDDNHSDI